MTSSTTKIYGKNYDNIKAKKYIPSWRAVGIFTAFQISDV